MDAESGIGMASSAAPESVIVVFASAHATKWYQMVAESGIGTASRAAPESIKVALPATMQHSGVKWKRSLA